jgi:UDP-2,4-diacetamido-2,4,6-trideoxy-beta-L-altropyranose hydrolase
MLFRCDASPEIGIGHLARCLVLADELRRRGGQAAFAMGVNATLGRERVESAGHELVLLPVGSPSDEAVVVAAAARARGFGWVGVDHYGRDSTYLEALSAAGVRVLAIDDLGLQRFPVDVLLNHNPGAERWPYVTRADTVRLLGLRYALVRKVCRDARPARPRAPDRLARVLVAFGGADAPDGTGRVVDSLVAVPQRLHVDVVIGPGYAQLAELEQRAARSPHDVTVHRNLPDLVAAMQSADLFVGAGGGTTWEACCLGLPLILAPIADNQRPIARAVVEAGATLSRGTAELRPEDVGEVIAGIDSGALAAAARVAWELVDGAGVERVTSHILA